MYIATMQSCYALARHAHVMSEFCQGINALLLGHSHWREHSSSCAKWLQYPLAMPAGLSPNRLTPSALATPTCYHQHKESIIPSLHHAFCSSAITIDTSHTVHCQSREITSMCKAVCNGTAVRAPDAFLDWMSPVHRGHCPP